ncbi:phage baseplate protein [Avibacterium avium]|uniref:phage baseplate protein n=1 Tax=Avibacterium avium TaxID=751 RepID=UPI003BF7F181
MSIVNLLFSALAGKRTTIGVLELDALLTESTSLSSQITEYPVEDGTVISDHITQESERLSLSGVITGAGTLFNVGLGKYKLISAKETLRELHANRELITIVTGLDVYQDFAIESIEIERNSDDGERLNVTAEFRKINKVSLRKEEMPPEKTSPSVKGKTGKTKAQVGKAATSKPTNIQQQRGITGLGDMLGIKGDAN